MGTDRIKMKSTANSSSETKSISIFVCENTMKVMLEGKLFHMLLSEIQKYNISGQHSDFIVPISVL